MSAASATRVSKLPTVEDVTDAFDDWSRNPSAEMKVRTTAIGTHVILFVGGKQIALGRGRGLVNALANALEEPGVA